MRAYCVIFLFCFAIDSISAACNRLPPGIERVIRGIDITSLDLIPIEIIGGNGFLHPIIELTCTTGRKWRNPADQSVEYDVPDQVEMINSLSGGMTDYKIEKYASHSEVKKGMAVSAGIEVEGGMFSASGSYKNQQQKMIDNQNQLISMFAFVSAYEVQLRPYLQQKMASSFSLYFNRLPATYAADPGAYQEFLSVFGTHFFDSGNFGGYFSTKIEVDESLVQRKNGHEIEAEAKATFAKLVNAHGGYAGTSGVVSDDFKKYSNVHEAYYGGVANLMGGTINNYQQWWSSVPHDPWLFGGKLVPLWKWLPLGSKRDGLIMAIQVKLDKAYMEDLLRTVDYMLPLPPASSRDSAATQKTVILNYHNQLNALKNQVIPNHGQVISLCAAIEGFVSHWRALTVKDCAHNRKYCNPGLPVTRVYHPVTGRDNSGRGPRFMN